MLESKESEKFGIYGKNVVVVGRLDDENSQVVIEYLKREHNVFLVNPKLAGKDFLGVRVYSGINDILDDIDSAIIYMSPETIERSGILNELSGIDSVILPPGADGDSELIKMIKEMGCRVDLECPRVRLTLEYGGRK